MNRQCHTNLKQSINSKASIKLYIELNSLSVVNFVEWVFLWWLMWFVFVLHTS